MVCENLHDFYHMNLDNYAVAAVKDFISKEYYDYFGLTDEEDVYCNSGVMLFNLDNWRRMGIEQSISNYLKENKGFVCTRECKCRILFVRSETKGWIWQRW